MEESFHRCWRAAPRAVTMGANQSGMGGGGGPPGGKDKKKDKKKFERPAPAMTGRKKKKHKKGSETAGKLPAVTPNAKCKLRLLKVRDAQRRGSPRGATRRNFVAARRSPPLPPPAAALQRAWGSPGAPCDLLDVCSVRYKHGVRGGRARAR